MDAMDKEADGKGAKGGGGETLGGSSEEGKRLLESLEGRRVTVTGVFDHSREVLVGESFPLTKGALNKETRKGGRSTGLSVKSCFVLVRGLNFGIRLHGFLQGGMLMLSMLLLEGYVACEG